MMIRRAASPTIGWRPAFILFLAALTPLTPLMAAIEEERASMPRPDHGTHAAEAATDSALPLTDPPALQSPADSLLAAGAEHLSRHLLWLMLAEGAAPGPDVCARGKAAGDREASGALWFVLGMTVWGVPIAYAIRPSPDEHLLAGVPEADRTLYDYCYGDAVRAVHVKWAWIGLATLVLLSMIGGLIVYSMQRSNFN